MSTTLSELRTIGYSLLREEEDSTVYPYTLIDLNLNMAQQNICSTGRVINPLTKEEVRKWKLHFMNEVVYYKNTPPTSLASDAVVWATTLTVSSTTNFPTTWALYIAWDIILYTGTTWTQFTWCTWILYPFQSWMSVSEAFIMPANYWSITNVTYNNKIKLPWKLYDDIFEDLNQYKWNPFMRNQALSFYETPYRIAPFYTIIKWQYMVIFNYNDLNWIVQVRYEKVPTTMTTWSSVTIIDNDLYAQSTLPHLAVGTMLFYRWEEQRGWQLISYAISNLRMMYDWYNSVDREDYNWVQYRTAKSKFNI